MKLTKRAIIISICGACFIALGVVITVHLVRKSHENKAEIIQTTEPNVSRSPTNSSTPETIMNNTILVATISKMDVSGLAHDAPAKFTLKTSDLDIELQVASGESNCDIEAIRIPQGLHVGSKVEVSAEYSKQSPLLWTVCKKGTFIRLAK